MEQGPIESLSSSAMLAPLLALLLTAPAAAQDGWRTTLTSDHAGQTIEFTSPNAALRLGKGEALHPEIPAHNLIVEYEALLVLPAAGVHRFALEVEGGIGSLSLSNPADPDQVVTIDVSEERGTPLAQPGADLSELLIRVRFERSGANPARLRTLWAGNLSDGSRFDFEPIPGRLVRQAPGSDTASGDQAFLGRVLLEVEGCTSCHNPGVQGAHAVSERRSPKQYKALVSASWLWKNPEPLEADDLRLVKESEQLNTSPPLATLVAGRGCLDPEDTNTPRYLGLSSLDRAALAAGIESVKNAVGDPAPMDAGRRRYEVLGCTNCHTMNGGARVSLGRELGEHYSGAPDLGDVGWRLEEDWIGDVLTGREKARRPDLSYKMRMPSFPSDLVEPLSTYLAASAGVPTSGTLTQSADIAELASAGRDLAGTDRMGCVSCHYLGERIPTTLGPFDLARFPKRLRHEWFDAFVISPARLQPGATMPGLDDGGESVVHDVLRGDLSRQADALWTWCEHAHELADPVGTQNPERGVIGDKPVVLEATFAGRELRCVGTPAGLHLGWDAKTGHLTEAWVNPFISPKPDRAEDRGAVIWRAPTGPSLLVGSKPDKWPDSAPEGEHEFRRAGHGDWGASRRIGTLTMHETASGRTVPELVVVRTVELANLEPREHYWFRPGAGKLTIESVRGCDARKHPSPLGEAPWVELVPHPGKAECSIRVALRP
jgi:cytochrome c2